MVASRMVLLDHLTKGRVILGVGPGTLTSDAVMLGIDPTRQREMLAPRPNRPPDPGWRGVTARRFYP